MAQMVSFSPTVAVRAALSEPVSRLWTVLTFFMTLLPSLLLAACVLAVTVTGPTAQLFVLVAWVATAIRIVPWWAGVAVRRWLTRRTVIACAWSMLGAMTVVSLVLVVAPTPIAAVIVAPILGITISAHRELRLPERAQGQLPAERRDRHARIATETGLVTAFVVGILCVLFAGSISAESISVATQIIAFTGVVATAAAFVVMVRDAQFIPGVHPEDPAAEGRETRRWWDSHAVDELLGIGNLPRRDMLLALAFAAVAAASAVVLPVALLVQGGPLLTALALAAALACGWLSYREAPRVPLLSHRYAPGALLVVTAVCAAAVICVPAPAGTLALAGMLGLVLGATLRSAPSACAHAHVREAVRRVGELLAVGFSVVAAVGAAASGGSGVVSALAVIVPVVFFASAAAVFYVSHRGSTKKSAPADADAGAEASTTKTPKDPEESASSAPLPAPGEVSSLAKHNTERDADTARALPELPTTPTTQLEPEPVLARVGETPLDCGRGRFVVIEGGDGSGKTTLIAALVQRLAEVSDQDIVTTKEPGGTVPGQKLRDLLLGDVPWSPRAEALLFAADRAHHVASVIRPALDEESVVLCDRYVDSSVAYQAGGRELPLTDIVSVSNWATQGLYPHLTVVLDVDPEVGARRRDGDVSRGGEDRIEAESLEFQKAVRKAFLDRAEAHPERYVVIDAAQPAATVIEEAFMAVRAILDLPAKEDTSAGKDQTPEALTRSERDTSARVASGALGASVAAAVGALSSRAARTEGDAPEVGPESSEAAEAADGPGDDGAARGEDSSSGDVDVVEEPSAPDVDDEPEPSTGEGYEEGDAPEGMLPQPLAVAVTAPEAVTEATAEAVAEAEATAADSVDHADASPTEPLPSADIIDVTDDAAAGEASPASERSSVEVTAETILPVLRRRRARRTGRHAADGTTESDAHSVDVLDRDDDIDTPEDAAGEVAAEPKSVTGVLAGSLDDLGVESRPADPELWAHDHVSPRQIWGTESTLTHKVVSSPATPATGISLVAAAGEEELMNTPPAGVSVPAEPDSSENATVDDDTVHAPRVYPITEAMPVVAATPQPEHRSRRERFAAAERERRAKAAQANTLDAAGDDGGSHGATGDWFFDGKLLKNDE